MKFSINPDGIRVEIARVLSNKRKARNICITLYRVIEKDGWNLKPL